MKKGLILLAGVAVALASCSDEALLSNDAISNGKKAIGFGADVTNATRASYAAGNFVTGDVIVVNGFDNSTTGGGTAATSNQIFSNQEVKLGEDGWTYSPLKYWEYGNKYDFYAAFPKTTVAFNATTRMYTVSAFTVDNKDEKASGYDAAVVKKANDLMIADQILGATPFQKVNFTFRHILSNVNFEVKPAVTVGSGKDITSIVVNKVDIFQVASKGTYTQNAWNNNQAFGVNSEATVADDSYLVGGWNADEASIYNFPERTNITLSSATAQPLYTDYLMIPQKLFTKTPQAGTVPSDNKYTDPTIEITYTINFKDGLKQQFTRSLRLSSVKASSVDKESDAVGSQTSAAATDLIYTWYPNYKYTYTLAINPNKSTKVWEADANGGLATPVPGAAAPVSGEEEKYGDAKYNIDDPNHVQVYEEGQWKTYDVAWEDIDGDGKLEVGLDTNKDGKIDNVDGDKLTEYPGDTVKDPTDGNDTKNPDGKDAILVNAKDGWQQVEKDPATGKIGPEKETQDSFIEFSAKVAPWAVEYNVPYNITK